MDNQPETISAERPALERFAPIVLGAAVFLLPLALYLHTLSPSIYPGDSAELIAAAWCLGVPHPTGYPLFMLLGHAFQHLGVGSPAFSMNLMCALFGALACVGVYRMQRELWRQMVGRRLAATIPWRFTSASVALAMGCGATWWGQSNMTEVYSMMMALIAFAWATGLRLIRRPTRRGLLCLAFLSGVGFLHHQLFLITLPVSGLGLLAYLKKNHAVALAENGRTITLALLLFFLPLTGYIYLPLSAATSPPINPGNPRGLQGIIDHVTGKQYRATRVLCDRSGRKIPPEEIVPHVKRRLASVTRWMGEQYTLPAWIGAEKRDLQAQTISQARAPLLATISLLVAAGGLYALWRRLPLAAAGITIAGALNLAVVIIYTIADIQAYQMPLWLLVGSLVAVGPLALANFISPHSPLRAQQRRAWMTGVAFLLLSALSLWNFLPTDRMVNKSKTRRPIEYARKLMETLPPNAIVFTTGDYDIYPLWYVQVCEGARPDVAVVGANFLFSRWYAPMLEATLPNDIEIYIGDSETPPTELRWKEAFEGGAIATQLLAKRPVFMTFFPYQQEFDLLMRKSAYKYSFVTQFPSPTPIPKEPDLFLYQIQDQYDAAQEAVKKFHEKFPDYASMMVRRSAGLPSVTLAPDTPSSGTTELHSTDRPSPPTTPRFRAMEPSPEKP